MEKIEFPSFMARDPVKAELWLRMVFSALVDADYLVTERHFTSRKTAARSTTLDIGHLWELFRGRHSKHTKGTFGLVNEVGSEVYDACSAAAEKPPGIFRLAVPTGGGKTLSAMGFALRHATLHNLERVIVAVPFISITQQTAEVYRDFLEENPLAEPETVLEHHSMARGPEDDEYDPDLVWSRLAAENWDAPVVVTTTVQLFENLFSNRTSATRKLHRLARSVIVLDARQSGQGILNITTQGLWTFPGNSRGCRRFIR